MRELQDLKDIATKRMALSDSLLRHRFVDAYIGLRVMGFNNQRTLGTALREGHFGPEASIGKYYWSRWHKEFTELGMEIPGPNSVLGLEWDDTDADKRETALRRSFVRTCRVDLRRFQRDSEEHHQRAGSTPPEGAETMTQGSHHPTTGSPRDSILDLSRILAAPFATQLLGDLGAEVIKVERPGVGDDARQYGPPFFGDAQGTDSPGFYLSTNQKRSITIDHSKPQGAELIRKLASVSDVVVENFRSGVLAKYGLDYDSLSSINPRLVYCSVTGFRTGRPLRHACHGYDGVFQAMSGMMSVSGVPDGEPAPAR